MFEELDDPIPFVGIPGARGRVVSGSHRRRQQRRRRRSAAWIAAVAGVPAAVLLSNRQRPDTGAEVVTDVPEVEVGVEGPALVLSSSGLDPLAVDHFAPTSGPSNTNGLRVDRAVREQQWRLISECLVDDGFEPLPRYVDLGGRNFAFPDPADLLENGFHTTTAAGSEDEPMSTDPEWLEARNRCDSENALRRPEGLDSWYSEVDASMARPEETEAWAQVRPCFAAKGYTAEQLETESRFRGAVQGKQMAAPPEADLHAIELEGARDYVDCAGPVWDARAQDLERRRAAWLPAHEARIIEAQVLINEYLAR